MLRTAGTASRSGRKVQVFQVRKHLETECYGSMRGKDK